MTIPELIQLVYEVPSFILYLIFTIRLGYKLLTKEKSFSNTFYIILFYKATVDLILQTSTFLFSKPTRFSVFNKFLKENSFICSIFYLITTSSYTITYQVMLIMSLNRYIAIGYPLLYNSFFQNYQVCIYMFITFVIGGSIGIVSSMFSCDYIFSKELNRLYLSYVSKDVAIFVMAYTFGLYVPLVIVSFILNIATIRKLKLKNFISQFRSTADSRLLIYTLFSFVTAIFFLQVYILRAISVFTGNVFFNVIGTTSLPYIVDIETFGSFYFSIFTNPQLMKMFCFQKMTDTKAKVFSINPNALYLVSRKRS